MKTFFTFFCLISISAFAQAPQSFSYQSVIYDNSGQYVSEQTIAMKISIIQDSESGTVVYSEVHHPETNTKGMVSILVGTGMTPDDFSAIDWSTGMFFIKSEIDINNGTNYTITGAHQLLSVPFALYAENAVPKSYVDSLADSLLILIEELSTFNMPTADFISSDQVVRPGGNVTFTSTSSTNVSSYLWSFEGGSPTSSTQTSPFVSFSNQGSYTVSLKVSNPYGEDSIIKEDYIIVPSAPVAAFFSSDTIINVGESVTFTSTSTNNPTSYYWEFSTASATTSTTASTLSNPTVFFNTQGSYTISLTVSNLSGYDKEIKTDFIQCNDTTTTTDLD